MQEHTHTVVAMALNVDNTWHETSLRVQEIRVITDKIREDEVSGAAEADWKFAAMVSHIIIMIIIIISIIMIIIIIIITLSSGAGQTLPLLLLCLHAGGDGGGARRGAPHHRLLILYWGHCFSLDYCDLSLVNFFSLAPALAPECYRGPWPHP